MQGYEGVWVYADENLLEYQAVVAAMGKTARRLVSPQDFQEAANTLRAPFVKWVDDCLAESPPRDWLTSPLCKNTFDSLLFLHLVWLVSLERALSDHGEDVVVVTRSLGLARTLEQLCRGRSLQCQCHGKARLLFGQVAADVMVFLKWGGKVLNLLCRVVLAKTILGKQYISSKLSTVELLVETYLHEGELNERGEFSSRYFPGLLEYYRAKGMNAAYFPLLYRIPLLRCGVAYSRMKRSATPFLPFELFIGIRDVMLAAWMSLARVRRTSTVKVFCGFNVDELVNLEKIRVALGGVVPLALSFAPRRMAEEGVRPGYFVDWFENQAIDKGVNRGLHEGMPSCRVIAAKLYIPSRNMISLFTSPGEVAANVAPSDNWVCGEALKAVVALYAPPGEYHVMPALRYSHLYRAPGAADKADALLILLSHSQEESLGIMDRVAPILNGAAQWGLRVVVKTHPDMDAGRFRNRLINHFPGSHFMRIEWTDRKLAELLPAARVVVTSGSSSALEAVCRGVPIILVGRVAGLDYNPLEWVDGRMWDSVYTSEQLTAAVSRHLRDTVEAVEEKRRLADAIKLNFFLEASEENMARFLPNKQQAA